jgi:hypothetical protein
MYIISTNRKQMESIDSIDTINWESLPIPVPENVKTYGIDTQQSIFTYLSQLTPLEQKAYIIASNHLGTSFHILRSIGYTQWIKKQK